MRTDRVDLFKISELESSGGIAPVSFASRSASWKCMEKVYMLNAHDQGGDHNAPQAVVREERFLGA